jgi:hypothetical protein
MPDKNKDGHLLNSPYGDAAMDSDFESIIAVDVNNDSNYEIIFTSNILSGYYGQMADIRWYFPNDTGHSSGGSFVFKYAPWYKIYLEKESDQSVYIKYKDDKNDLRIARINQSNEFNVQFFMDIPSQIREILGDNYN